MELNRADMKLLTEAGYSGILRNIDTDVTPIFEALETWLPDHGAGLIGIALQNMVKGEFQAADAILTSIIETKPQGRSEARAILALCKALQDDMLAAEALAEDLKGEGSAAEEFASLLVEGEEAETQGSQDPATAAAG